MTTLMQLTMLTPFSAPDHDIAAAPVEHISTAAVQVIAHITNLSTADQFTSAAAPNVYHAIAANSADHVTGAAVFDHVSCADAQTVVHFTTTAAVEHATAAPSVKHVTVDTKPNRIAAFHVICVAVDHFLPSCNSSVVVTSNSSPNTNNKPSTATPNVNTEMRPPQTAWQKK